MEDLRNWAHSGDPGNFELCLTDDVTGDPFSIAISAAQNVSIRCIKATGGLCGWPGRFSISGKASLKISKLLFSGLKGPGVSAGGGGTIDVDSCTFTKIVGNDRVRSKPCNLQRVRMTATAESDFHTVGANRRVVR